MCGQCLSQAEFAVAKVALIAAIAKEPVHRALASVGAVAEPLAVARDAHTAAFLRRLDLDPRDVLGAEVTDRADAWVASGGYEAREAARRSRARSWARPIGSHRRLAPK